MQMDNVNEDELKEILQAEVESYKVGQSLDTENLEEKTKLRQNKQAKTVMNNKNQTRKAVRFNH